MRYTKPKLIQLIHIAKHKLGIDEETYRMILQNETGKTSCKAMTLVELMQVYHHFEKAGFKRTAKRKSPASSAAKVKHDIALKIRAIWIEMAKAGVIRDGSEAALNSFVRNTINPILQKQGSNVLILNVQSLDYKFGTIVLERLKKWQKRTQKEVK